MRERDQVQEVLRRRSLTTAAGLTVALPAQPRPASPPDRNLLPARSEKTETSDLPNIRLTRESFEFDPDPIDEQTEAEQPEQIEALIDRSRRLWYKSRLLRMRHQQSLEVHLRTRPSGNLRVRLTNPVYG